jgi:hypothetical protein
MQTALLAAVSAAALMGLSAIPAHAGDATRGVVPASARVVSQVAADISEPGAKVKASCLSVLLAQSDPRWAYVSHDSDCSASPGTPPVVMTKWRGSWQYVYFMGKQPTCKQLTRGTQSTFGPSASRAVLKDFTAAGLCTRG